MICPECGQEFSEDCCSNCGFLLVSDNQADTDEYFYPEDNYQPEPGVNIGQRTKDYRTNATMRKRGWEDSRGNRNLENRSNPDDNTDISNRARKEKKPVSRKSKAGPAKSRAAKSSRSADRKEDRKERQKKENRIKKLEKEMERLRVQKEAGQTPSKTMNRRKGKGENKRGWDVPESIDRNYYGRGEGRIQEADKENSMSDEISEAITKGAVGIIVIASRLMQLLSALLMAGMVCLMADSFWKNGQNLGDIRYLAEEGNYGLALYGAAAIFTLFMGLLWCLWILSRKGAGGGFRLKRYDTGRGFLPFLFCLAAVFAAGILLPQVPHRPEALKGMAGGAAAFLEAVNDRQKILFLGSGLGAVLSLLRKLLSV